MPLVDVNDVLLDPDVAGQSFTVLRRQEVVNDHGESVLYVKTIPGVIGSIQPSGDQNLIRDGAFDAQNQSIKIVTPFRLFGVTKGSGALKYKPDVIIYAQSMFEITSPNDWAAFGRGFIEADAVEIPWISYGPMPQIPYIGRLDFSQPANSALAYGAAGGSRRG